MHKRDAECGSEIGINFTGDFKKANPREGKRKANFWVIFAISRISILFFLPKKLIQIRRKCPEIKSIGLFEKPRWKRFYDKRVHAFNMWLIYRFELNLVSFRCLFCCPELDIYDNNTDDNKISWFRREKEDRRWPIVTREQILTHTHIQMIHTFTHLYTHTRIYISVIVVISPFSISFLFPSSLSSLAKYRASHPVPY